MPAIAPITGMLKKHLLTHIGISGVGGAVCGYGYWYGIHMPKVVARDNYYLALQKQKEAEANE